MLGQRGFTEALSSGSPTNEKLSALAVIFRTDPPAVGLELSTLWLRQVLPSRHDINAQLQEYIVTWAADVQGQRLKMRESLERVEKLLESGYTEPPEWLADRILEGSQAAVDAVRSVLPHPLNN